MAFRDTSENSIVRGTKVPAAIIKKSEEIVLNTKKGEQIHTASVKEKLVEHVQEIRGFKRDLGKARVMAGAIASKTLRHLKDAGKIKSSGSRKQSYVRV